MCVKRSGVALWYVVWPSVLLQEKTILLLMLVIIKVFVGVWPSLKRSSWLEDEDEVDDTGAVVVLSVVTLSTVLLKFIKHRHAAA